MKPRRILPLMLAAGLQVMPMLRAVLPLATQGLAPSTWAIILKFAAGSVALLGSYHAVSGATAIVAPYTVNATVGTRYTRQLGTSGQTAHSWSASTAPVKSAVYPLTPGLFLTNATGKIGGIPTAGGTSNIVIKAWENSGNSGASVSATFVFTITNSSGGTPPAITQQPQNQTVTAGQTASFAVTATGTAPLAYFWRKGAVVVQTGSSSTCAIANAQAANAGTYSVIVSNSAGTVTSANATLTVNAVVTPPAITQQPQNQTVTAGQTASFAVTATGTAPLAYFWRKGTAVVQTGSSSTCAIANAQAGNAGTYSVIVSNSAGTVTSANATLTVNAVVTPPAITQQPQNQTVTAGQTASFAVTATGTAPLTYFWRKGTAAVQTGTNAAYALSNAQAGDAGTYSVIVSNSAGTVTSANAVLTVSTPIVIAGDPTNQIATAGSTVTFRVTVTGNPTGYQWRFNSNAIAGATSATLNLTNVTPANSGYYSVLVTNATTRVTSRDARLMVMPPPSVGMAPTLRQAGLAAGRMQLSLGTSAGYRYVVQYNNTLRSNTWVTLTNIPADFTGATVALPQNVTSSPQRFYRVLVSGN